MSDQARQMTEDEAAEFAEQVFDVARKGDAPMLAALLSKGLPPNLRNHKGDTLLMLASYHGHADAVRVLLEHKADPQIQNDNGQSPIAGAAFKGDLEMVRLLIEGGAQVEGTSKGRPYGVDDGGDVQSHQHCRLPAQPGCRSSGPGRQRRHRTGRGANHGARRTRRRSCRKSSADTLPPIPRNGCAHFFVGLLLPGMCR